MLQIKNICKEYKTGTFVQKALDNVSLNLRDNEFVAILGPSGSGKTTLLNIIGGLDRYDSGDLVINGISTKKYKERDWDSYRNHTIGFVFQSYNLIPHQSVLANVELALTISGVSRKERKMRALEALDKVGLKDQAHKKPNQLSGGQMQRVAIARALVNNPAILLADEPTGALDSDTSLQVMDLLKEVASDRLVVMVTHNPELAERYATRIVKLRDGRIVSDTHPLTVEGAGSEGIHKNLGHASMSFLTSLGLSFSNLRTKLTRTLLVAFAGSIGIIGIALILAMSNGVNNYIKNTEEDTLSEYPISISRNSYDFTSILGIQESMEEAEDTGEVREMKAVEMLLSILDSNDLESLRAYIEENPERFYKYARAIEYDYGITPLIYRHDGTSFRQINPNNSFASLGLTTNSFMASASYSMDVFYRLPESTTLYEPEYELKAGHWPENANECVVVLSPGGGVTDFLLYTLGLKDADELDTMINEIVEEGTISTNSETTSLHYQDFLGITMKVINAADCYTYDSEHGTYIKRTEDTKYISSLAEKGIDLVVSGVVQRREDVDAGLLSNGIWYSPDLIWELVEASSSSEIVKAQLKDPDMNVLTGVPFGETADPDMDMSEMFSIDESAIQDAFQFNTGGLSIDTSALTDLTGIDFSGLSGVLDSVSLDEILQDLDIRVSPEALGELVRKLGEGYLAYASSDPSTDYANLPSSFRAYLSTPEAAQLLTSELSAILQDNAAAQLTADQLQSAVVAIMSGFQAYAEANGLNDPARFSEYLQSYMATPEAQALLQAQLQGILQSVIAGSQITQEQAAALASKLADSYNAYAASNSLPDLSKLGDSVSSYIQSEEGRQLILDGIRSAVNVDEIEAQLQQKMNETASQLTPQIQSIMQQMIMKMASGFAAAIQSALSDPASLITFNADAFAKAFEFKMDENELAAFMATMMNSGGGSTLRSNLSAFGYTTEEDVDTITIYPIDFDSKEQLKTVLADYNDAMEEAGTPEKAVSYTDIVGTMMSSVSDIVNAISIALIVFVSISLIVSSIMIGVITYISVLERRKEIGILRAMGASRLNVAQMFSAETFITGLLAGLLGVLISQLVIYPGNIILRELTGFSGIVCVLPFISATILVLLSIFLTLVGGAIPSSKASHSDPVAALRTE